MRKKKKPVPKVERKPVARKALTRKQRYATDPAYRKACIESALKYYRENKVVVHEDPIRFLKKLPKKGIYITDGKKKYTVYKAQNVADVFECKPVYIYKLWSSKMLPKPTMAIDYSAKAYTLNQMEYLIKALSEHYQKFGQYKAKHKEFTKKLFEGFNKVGW